MSTFDPGGDEPIDLGAHQYTLAQAARLGRVTEKAIRNWIARDFLPIGRRRPGGHYVFSVDDVVRAVVVGSRPPGCDVKDAVRIADIVIEAARASTDSPDGRRANVNVVVATAEDGSLHVQTADIRTPAHYPPPSREGAYNPLRRPHWVLPATAILIDILLATRELEAGQSTEEEANA